MKLLLSAIVSRITGVQEPREVVAKCFCNRR